MKNIVINFLTSVVLIVYITQDIPEELVILSSSNFMRFNTVNETIEQFPSDLDLLEGWDGVLSPEKRFLIYWEMPVIQTTEVRLMELNHPNASSIISLPSPVLDVEFMYAEWPFGERFSIIKAGIYVEVSDSNYPQPQVTNLWLVDIEEKTAISWYWDCTEVVHLHETNNFALRCLYADGLESKEYSNEVFLNSDGFLKNENRAYNTIYQSNNSSEIFSVAWRFSPQMDKVAFASYGGDGLPDWSIWVYDLSSGFTYENFLSVETITDLTWSPFGEYIAIFNACIWPQEICLYVMNVKNGNIAWDSTRLPLKLIRDTSLVWATNDEVFFVYGKDYDSYERFLWFVTLDKKLPVAQWNLQRGGALVRYDGD